VIINYIIISILSFSGIVAGFILGSYTKEELKKGEKYISFLQKAMIFLIIVFLFYYLKINAIMIFSILLLTLVYYYKDHKNKKIIESKLIYPILGVIFFLSYFNPKLFIINALLIFLYGMSAGSILFYKKISLPKVIIEHISFLVISSLLILI